MDDEHDVGYGKPPTHSQFRKGRSGNPKGRPKGSSNFSTDLKETLEEPIRVTEHGKSRTVSTQLATLKRLRGKALSGDARALDRLIELARLYNDEETPEAAAGLDATDAGILEAHDEKVLQQAGVAQKSRGVRRRGDARRAPDAASHDASEEGDDDGGLH